jgi:hypothetical protein
MSDSNKRKRDEESKEDGEICTLHISGFPINMMERELKNLCRYFPGCTASSISSGKAFQRPIGFARFETRELAEEAIPQLSGIVFDDEDPDSVLRVSLAKRNLVPRLRRNPAPARGGYGDYQGMYGMYPYAMGMSGGYVGGYGGGMSTGTMESRESGTVSDTLCVRGLGMNCSKRILEEIFSQVSGYQFMSYLRPRGGSSSGLAFVRFVDTTASTNALRAVAGQSVSHCQGRVSVEYARRSLTEQPADDQ